MAKSRQWFLSPIEVHLFGFTRRLLGLMLARLPHPCRQEFRGYPESLRVNARPVTSLLAGGPPFTCQKCLQCTIRPTAGMIMLPSGRENLAIPPGLWEDRNRWCELRRAEVSTEGHDLPRTRSCPLAHGECTSDRQHYAEPHDWTPRRRSHNTACGPECHEVGPKSSPDRDTDGFGCSAKGPSSLGLPRTVRRLCPSLEDSNSVLTLSRNLRPLLWV
jgi:hypothetical protein